MADRVEDEERVRVWLGQRHYNAERPHWLPPGQNPDFWATAISDPQRLWVEVKSIDVDDSTAALGRAQRLVRDAKIPEGLHGHALLHVHPHAIEQSVQWALKTFEREAPNFRARTTALAFVQQTPNGRDVTRIEIIGEDPAVIWVRGSGNEALSPPIGLLDDLVYEQAKATLLDGSERRGQVYELFEWNNEQQCSLVVRLEPSKRKITSISTMSGGPSQGRERTFSALKSANKQIKAAALHREAPGVVFILPQAGYMDESMIQAAIYGVITVPLKGLDGDIALGDPYHGKNGIFRRDKNRHLSAVVLLPPGDTQAVYFPNPFAHWPIADDALLFGGARRANIAFV